MIKAVETIFIILGLIATTLPLVLILMIAELNTKDNKRSKK